MKLFLDDRFKVTDSTFSIKGKINDLSLEHEEIKNIKKFLPSYSSKIVLKDSEELKILRINGTFL